MPVQEAVPEPQARKQVTIDVSAADTIETAVNKLQIKPSCLILLLGDFDNALMPRIRAICSRAIAPLAVRENALIVDNGNVTGCSAAIGQALAEQDDSPELLCVVPNDLREVEPNHNHVLRLPAEWPDPKSKFQIVAQLVKDGEHQGERPVVALVAGGGDNDKAALVRCVRRGWRIVFIAGSGGLADQIVAAKAPPADNQPAAVLEPVLQEIIETGDLTFFPIGANLDDLNRILQARLDKRSDTLQDAWARCDGLCEAAAIKQSLFRSVQAWVFLLALFATLLAIGQSDAAIPMWLKGWLPAAWKPWLKHEIPEFRGVMHILILLVPIASSVLIGSNTRFREGNKWIILRSVAEAIKREIFRYRTQSGDYSNEKCADSSRDSKLAAKIKELSTTMVQSEVNKTNIPSCYRDKPDRLTFLTADEYVTVRLEDQITFYVRKTKQFYGRLKRIQLSILIAGGLGTILAAISLDVWVALTTAIATGLTARMETDQIESNLMQYNMALTNLQNIETWWKALTHWEKSRRKNIDLLVDQTEKALEAETSIWVHQMQTALDKLTEKEQGNTGEPQPKQAAAAAAGR